MAVAPAAPEHAEHPTDEGHHAPVEAGAAPTHLDVRERFSFAQMAFAWALGAIAIVAGIVLGLTVVNN